MGPDMERQVSEMSATIKALTAEMRGSIGALTAEMRGSIGALTVEMRGSTAALKDEIGSVRVEMRDSIAGIKGDVSAFRAEVRDSAQRLDRKMDRLSIEFLNHKLEMNEKHEAFADEMKGIYRSAAWAAEAARASADKVFTHGAQLVDHEDRLRALEGKRKAPPSA